MFETINGRYVLQTEIGSGGMGIVYKTYDRLTDETVALKRVRLNAEPQVVDSLSPHDTQEQLRLVLAKEFQILAGLRHPNIISVLDYGFDAEQQPFYTMTFLEESQTILEAGVELDIDGKIDLIEQLLQGLAYLHRRGILHRDIKPENVLVAAGVVKLLDFGLSHNMHEKGTMGGSPLYMAPEVLDNADPTRAADLYAVGVLFYQLLTGQHPFGTFDTGFYRRLLTVEPNWHSIDDRLSALLSRLLAKNLSERLSSARAALRDLAETLDRHAVVETAAIRESYLQAAKFVGREEEMAQITAVLDLANRGQGSAWLIGGESGAGKSRLLNELSSQALVNGFVVLTGQSKQEGGGLPFQLWRDILRHALVSVPEVDDLTASVLLPLVPDISDLLQRDVKPAPELHGSQARLRLFTTIATLIHTIERPTLLILEDLHWVRESLLPIPFLLQSIGNRPLLVMGSYRNDEQPKLQEQLPGMGLIVLERLTPQMISELSMAMLGEIGRRKDIVALLQQETEGNAFFAVEVVRALAEEVGRLEDIGKTGLPRNLLPNGIQDIVGRQLARVPQPARDLLELAAVAGRELELSLIECLATGFGYGIEVEDWWLPLCADASILEINQGKWRFRHAKIQEGLLAQLDRKTLAAKHERVAETIEALYPDSADQAARLAYHWGQAENVERERAYAFQAGQHAAGQFSNEDAITFFSQALEKTPPEADEEQYKILLARELVYAASAIDREKQTADLNNLMQLAKQLHDPAKQAYVALQQAKLLTYTGRFEEAISASRLAIEQGERAGKEELVIEGYAEWGAAAGKMNQLEIGRKYLESSVERSRETGHFELLGNLLNSLGLVYSELDLPKKEMACYEEALAIARQTNDLKLESRLYNNMSLVLSHEGKESQARAYSEKALRLYKKIGDLLGEGIVYVNMGIDWYRDGDYKTAFSYLKNSLLIFRQVNDWIGEDLALFFISLVAERLDIVPEAARLIEESITMGEGLHMEMARGHFLLHLGFLHKQQKEFNRATHLFEQALAQLDPSLYQGAVHTIHFHMARMAQEREQWELAETGYQQLLDMLKAEQKTPLRLPARSGLATVYLAKGDVVQAAALVEPVVLHLLQGPLNDGWHDMRMALQSLHILDSVNDARATTVLMRAFQTLQARTALIGEEEARRYALEAVPEHAEIIRRYQAFHREMPKETVTRP